MVENTTEMMTALMHIHRDAMLKFSEAMKEVNNSEEPINYPAGNLLAHFKRYLGRYKSAPPLGYNIPY
jgi:hypothetical protein